MRVIYRFQKYRKLLNCIVSTLFNITNASSINNKEQAIYLYIMSYFLFLFIIVYNAHHKA